jgi:hypothetical protein
MVTITVDGTSGLNCKGTLTYDSKTGKATGSCPILFSTAGTYTVYASYSGDALYVADAPAKTDLILK